MSDRPNFSAYCEQACRKLWGEPTRTTAKELRWINGGDAYSGKTFNLKKRVWYDHGAQVGGSTLELVSYNNGEPAGELRGAKFFETWQKAHELGIVPEPPPAADNSGKLKIRRTYPYQDANGELLYEVVRFDTEEKDDRFRQRRPDGRGGWIWKKGERQILYRLPELIEGVSQDRPILLCEGEHDAETARTLGYIATTAPGGAEKPWRNEYSETLRGGDVIVILDNDEHGRGQRHAQKIASILGDVARRARVLMFPVKDLTDWIAAGHTREELDVLIADALEFDASEQTEAPSEPVGLDVIDAGQDDWDVPPREWLLGNIFCREFVSSLLADGGTGKTTLRYAQYISLAAIGRSLTGEYVFQRCRVLVISLEDSISELRRRMKAACLHHGVPQAELAGWLFYAAIGAASGKLMVTDAKGRAVVGPLAASLEKTIIDKRIDLVALDPFVKTHAVEENHNGAIDGVLQILSDLAVKHSIAVDVPHHISKGAAAPGDANRGRGASAMKDAARLVHTLTPMSTEEAQAFGLTEAERRSLVRVDSGKVNTAPPMHDAKWFRLIGVQLGNATEQYPNGDSVQTVEPWSPPDIWRDLSVPIIHRILDDIETGLPDGHRYSAAGAARERAAWRVVVEHCPDKVEGPARQIISKWIKTGLLVSKEYDNPKNRHPAQGLWVDNSKRPS